MKIFLITLIVLITIIASLYSFSSNENIIISKEESLYHGPVPLNYDTEYFRETGITKKIINNGS